MQSLLSTLRRACPDSATSGHACTLGMALLNLANMDTVSCAKAGSISMHVDHARVFGSSSASTPSSGTEHSTNTGNMPEPWAQSMTKPVGKGMGFGKRFKDMRRHELKDLLQRSRAEGLQQDPRKRVKLPRPGVPYHVGQFATQWSVTEERITGPYKPDVRKDIFAVVEAGHTQHKVVADDKIFVHRLNGVNVDDVIQLNRVLLAGTPQDTLIGRPFLPGLTVTAAVEEHIRDSTVYIYKRRRAKGYRRFRGFRAELTGLRILEIKGAEEHGVAVPEWREGSSTPLVVMTAASLARQRAKQARRAAAVDAAPQDYLQGFERLEEPSGVEVSPLGDGEIDEDSGAGKDPVVKR